MSIEQLHKLLDDLEAACMQRGSDYASDEDAQHASTARAAIEAEFARLSSDVERLTRERDELEIANLNLQGN